ncbi:RDD family protein [soil metagenome]
MSSTVGASPDWPGKRLGLPEHGPRSVGRLGRRVLAIVIDWGFAVLVSVAFFHYDAWATLAVFAIEQVVFLLTLNGSIGHLVAGLRVVPLAGGYLGVWRPLARTALLCIVIPAVIWDRDQRGMHDRLVGTVLVRR